ncbi:NAD(P)-binding protein [Streptomyces phaeolivaceus]|uniref:NAD(P)-binding protein n=1 Tax=Streptomyces phaeolivaceus TaxID=2653200 RepID=A0A5P8KES5_9ACTN|nr:FAD-dependent oxidoreductase [Streptomyces phaeolivaceus]QFR01652.1 NAD(P)-binding protein [Streptomyces phaeolivaceus]
MARDPRHDVLFEPLRIGPRTLRNRFYVTPHATNFGTDFPGAEAYYRGMRAEGGWAAVSTGACLVNIDADNPRWNLHHLVDDGDENNLRLLASKVQEHGALAGVELIYYAAGTGLRTRLPARPGVSQVRSYGISECSAPAMTKADIRQIQRQYVDAARRAERAGFDLINVHLREAGSVAYQLLDPYLNTRTDEYGGSFANRVRFAVELFDMVRDAVDDCAIVGGFCIDSADGRIEAAEDGYRFIETIDSYVDLWDLQVGRWIYPDAGPSRSHRQGWQVPYYETVRPAATKPIVGVGRFTDPDVMADLVRTGVLDVIGAARPSISDPFLPAKVDEGRLEDIRECIGCNMCASRVEIPGAFIACTQNATVGEEYRRGWHPEVFTRPADTEAPVLVIGAGPAGLECAVTLGRRGFENVHLVDAGDSLGGIMRWIPRLPGLQEWSRFLDYRVSQLDRLKGVEVILNRKLTADDVLDYGAASVVVATGAAWDPTGVNTYVHRPVPGAAGNDAVYTPDQIMRDDLRFSGLRVVVFDADRYFMGQSIAERIAADGNEVVFVSSEADVQGYLRLTGEAQYQIRRLLDLGVKIVPNSILREVLDGGVELEDRTTGRIDRLGADAVVMVTQRVPDTSLHDALAADPAGLERAGITKLLRIGDCLVPRPIADAAFDGHRVAREFDSPDPGTPQTFIRERRVVGFGDGAFDGGLPPTATRGVRTTLPLVRAQDAGSTDRRHIKKGQEQ